MTKEWFESQFGKSLTIAPPLVQSLTTTNDSGYYFNETFQITPLWSFSKVSAYLQTQSIVLVPVKPIRFLDGKNQEYALVFFRDSTNQIASRLQVYAANENYKLTHFTLNVNDFSGTMFQICLDGRVERVYGLIDGQFRYKTTLLPNQDIGRIHAALRRSCDDLRRDSDTNGWEYFLLSICNLFGGSDGGGSTTVNNNNNSSSPTPTSSTYLGWGQYNTGGGYINGSGSVNSGGGGGTSFNTLPPLVGEIDGSLFDAGGQGAKYRAFKATFVDEWGFQDFDFDILYNNPQLFTRVEYYLRSRGRSAATAAAVKNNMSTAWSQPDLFVEYLRLLEKNNAFFNASSQAVFPMIGTLQWAQISDTNIHSDGQANFIGFTDQELASTFRMIPEDILTSPLSTPTNANNGTIEEIDGIFTKGWTDEHYWFKVSKGADVTITKSNNALGFEIVGMSEHIYWRAVANAFGRLYCTCWQGINQPRPNNVLNPLPR